MKNARPPSAKSLCPITRSPRARAAANQLTAKIKPHFPSGLPQPALRALANAGFTQLSDLTRTTEHQLAQLHGLGPKSLTILRSALHQRRLAFRA